MKSIILFSRCELVDLYGSISERLSENFNVIHLAYSKLEEDILRNKYGIKDIINFKHEIYLILNDKDKDISIEKLDFLFIEGTKGRFSFNSAIQSDRGFSILNYQEATSLSKAYYIFWDDFLSQPNIKIVLHELPSLFFNHVAAVICKRNKIKYCSQIMVNSDKKYSFLFIEGDDANAFEIESNYSNLAGSDIKNYKERALKYIDGFVKDNSVYMGDLIPSKIPYFKLLVSGLKKELIKIKDKNKLDRIVDNIDYLSLINNSSLRRFKNLIEYRFRLNYDEIDLNDKYYYYPIHLEPEAVVLYWGDGLYKGQIKLMQNIAAQLPPNTYLYVKDHPHYIGYRKYVDYQELQQVPNIKVLAPEISGKSVIRNSQGVITINGTGGFEGILMNKPVFVFGNAFYDFIIDKVVKVKHIKDLKSKIEEAKSLVYEYDDSLMKFVNAYLTSCHEGVSDYFAGRINKYPIDIDQNSKIIADAISKIN